MLEVSKTELVVCAYLTAGYNVGEISSKLFRSIYTVKAHVANIRKKNSLKNIAEISREYTLEYGHPDEFIDNL